MNGYCKYCDSLTNSIIKVFESGVLIWAGCSDCYIKKVTKDNATKQK